MNRNTEERTYFISEGKNDECINRSMSPGRGDMWKSKVTESFFQMGPNKFTILPKDKQLFLAGKKAISHKHMYLGLRN